MSAESKQDRVAHWQKRVEEAPDSAAAHFNLGLAHTERGRMMNAEKAYRRAVELDPDLVQAWVNLGGALLMKWDFQGSLEAIHLGLLPTVLLVELLHPVRDAGEEIFRCFQFVDRVLQLDDDLELVTHDLVFPSRIR